MEDKPRRLLIIDDCAEDREVMRLMLKVSGRRFVITEAETGAAGLRACFASGDGPPDCILLDYYLPDYAAPELLAALGGLDSSCCPVVVITGIASAIDGPSLLRQGAQDFIGKSWINAESLVRAIENAIDRFGMVQRLREREELARRQAEEMKALMDAAPIAIFLSRDPECRNIIGNRLADQWYEAEPGQNVSAGSALGEPSDASRRFFRGGREISPMELPMQTAMRERREISGDETEVVLPSGRTISLLGNASPLFDEAGRVRGSIGAFIDITERKQVDLALRESEARFRTLFESSADALTLLGEQGFFECNEAALRTFGYTSRKDLLGKHPSQISPATQPDGRDSAALAREIDAKALRDGSLKFEWQLLRSDGSTFPAEILLTRIQLQGRTVLQGNMRDITERKRMEQALRESEARFRTLFDFSPDFLALDGEQGFVDCNEAGLRQLGYAKREDLLGKFPYDISPPTQPNGRESKALVKELQEETFNKGKHKFEWQFRRVDGTEFPAEVLLTIVELQGQPMVFSTIRDISERKASLAALAEAKDKAEQASRAKSMFLANMSHEIRTPMNAVMGMTELCLKTDLSPQQRNYLSKIKAAANSLLHIIDDILDFSKIEAGKLDLLEEPFVLPQVLDNLAAILSTRAQSKGLELVIHLEPSLARQALLGDPHRLGQVLINLAGNAIKFSSRGQVRVSVSEQSRMEDRSILLFTVSDEGIGLTPEQQARLFQPFSQADASTTRNFGGTGLGLALSKSLVEMMGGQIGVDSALGQGSRFYFTLGCALVDPAQLPANQNTDEGIPTLAHLQGAHILLAEDIQLNQEMMIDLLEQAGLSVRLAVNGEQALKAVEASPPDCVLMDCHMPVMDGFEATRRLRSDPHHRDLPIIALTANTMAGDREACLAAGMNDFVSKPIHFEKLFRVLAQWIKPRQTVAPLPAQPLDSNALPPSTPIPALPGIDTVKGLGLVGGKPTSYLRLLKKFRDSLANGFVQSFTDAQQAGDLVTAIRHVHSLKGISRQLGIDTLGDLAEALERAIPQNQAETVTTVLAWLEEELCQVLDGLRRLEDNASGPQQ